jgi:hypothetical protein
LSRVVVLLVCGSRVRMPVRCSVPPMELLPPEAAGGERVVSWREC